MSEKFHVRLRRDASGSPAVLLQRNPPGDAVRGSISPDRDPRGRFADAPQNHDMYDTTAGRVRRRVPARDVNGNFTVLLADGPFAREARWFHSHPRRPKKLSPDRAVTLKEDGVAVLWTRFTAERRPNPANPCRDADGNPLPVLNHDRSRAMRIDGVPATTSYLSVNPATWHPELVLRTNIRLPADEDRAAGLLADVFWNEMNPLLKDPFVTDHEYDAFAEGENHADEPMPGGGTRMDHLLDVLPCLFAVHLGFAEGVEEILADIVFATPRDDGRVLPEAGKISEDAGTDAFSSFKADVAALVPRAYRFNRRNAPHERQTATPVSPRLSHFPVDPVRKLNVSLKRPTSHQIATFLSDRRSAYVDDGSP